MLRDCFGRTINYLRVSVTDKCNFRCVYCMPEAGTRLKNHNEILRLEQIAQIAAAGARLGITKVRITGGEPLVRRNLVQLVRWIAQIPKIEEVVMTTNGVLLDLKTALALKEAGLGRLNISLDTLNPDRFQRTTRCGRLQDTLNGIAAAKAAGLTPIKINMVIFKDTAQTEIDEMLSFCKQEDLTLQRILQFSLYDRADLVDNIQAERPPKCMACNRLRLTADGYFKPCLFSDNEIKVDMKKIEACIVQAVRAKPKCGASCNCRTMSQIGG